MSIPPGRRSVCVLTTTRADYGILRPLILALDRDNSIDLRLAVTGTHISQEFGLTLREIEEDRISIDAKIPIIDENAASGNGIIRVMAAAMERFEDYFQKRRPDLLIVLGDRYEAFAVCTAAACARITIAHIHGGEATEGLLDECFRHSMTKMSYLHFTSCEAYRRRVIQLGESPERVFNVGALSVENILGIPPMPLAELAESLDFPLEEKPYSVVTFHPVTLEDGTAENQLYELIRAMDAFPDMNYIVTLSNADAGGRAINRIWEREGRLHSSWVVMPSLGMRRYLSALRYSKMVLGNSSSGILEAPALHIPTVNIGDRQRGRVMADSVICCVPERGAIISAMEKALSASFAEAAKRVENPFGDGKTSGRIMKHILAYLDTPEKSLKKEFYDMRLEER